MLQVGRGFGAVFAIIFSAMVLLFFCANSLAQQSGPAPESENQDRRDTKDILFLGNPGTYDNLNGAGILAYDIKNNFRFIKRIPVWDVVAGKEPGEVRGMSASAANGLLFISNESGIAAISMLTDKVVWDLKMDDCCDRMNVSPDGKTLYVPSIGGDHRYWYVMDPITGKILQKLDPNPSGPTVGAHNTIFTLDGTRVFLGGVKSTKVYVADTETNKVVQSVGDFSDIVRPFTINGDGTLIYATINNFLGFEIGDVKTGKVIQHVPVAGYTYKPDDVKVRPNLWGVGDEIKHGMANHGIALSPDQKEIWLADGANECIHVFDNTVSPPKQKMTIKSISRPDWIAFGLDGKYAYPSTGEVIDAASKKVVTVLKDELGRPAESEKIVEVLFSKGKPVRASDQFGVGLVQSRAGR